MADAKLTALPAASALAGADLFYISQGGVSKRATHTQLLTLVGTTYVPLAGGTMTGALTLPAGTEASPGLVIGSGIGFYNTGGTVLDMSIAGAVAMRMSTNGWYLPKSTGLIELSSGGSLGWDNGIAGTGTTDIRLVRDAAATLAQRNGTTQQSFRLYNTYTDSSNYERLTLTGVAGTSVNLTAETLGTGVDSLELHIRTPASMRLYAFAYSFYNEGSAFAFSMAPSADGVVTFKNSAGNDWGRICFGGMTSSYPALKRSTTTLQARLADDSADAGFSALYVKTASTTVAGLTAAATAGAGARAFVTDANATTYLSTVAGGGANKVPVVSDGTNWLIG